ncbi:hypothetical protein BT69DRAFT_940191 [Atractiella rhizophila]|nr:hypothetical protein BT69DRAFT_940191 [Atractiella rhizophila]
MLSNTAHARVHPNAQDPHSPLLPQNGTKWDAPALDSRLDVSSMPSIGEGFDELDFPNDSTTKSTPSPLLPSDVKDESPLSVMNQLWEPPLPPAQRDEHNKAMQSILLGLRQRQPNRLLLDGWKVLDRLGTTERIKRDEDVVQMVHIITSEKLDFLYGNWDLAKRFLLWALERCGVRVIEIACWQLLRQLETKRCIEIWETASPHLSSVEINNKSSLSIGNSFLASVLAHALAKDRKSFKETLPRLVQSWPDLPYLHIRSLPRQKVDSFFRDVPEIKDDADRCLQWAKQAIFVIKLKNAEDPDEYVRSSADSWTKRNVPRDLEDLWEDYRAALNEGETQWIESFKAVDDSEAVDDFARQLWGSSSRPVEGNRQLIPNATINPAVLQAFLMCFTQHKLDTHAAEVWSLIKSFGFHRFRSSWYSVLWINMKTRNLRNLKIAMVDMNQLGLKPDAFCYALLTKCLMQEARGSHELDSDSRRQIELQAQKYMDGIFQSSKMRELERDNRFHPIVFTTLLEGFLPMRREQDVENLFTLAKELCRGSPVELYNTLLEFHGRNKNPAIAMQTMSMTLKRMVAANVEPNGGTFAILMKYGPRHAIPSIIENMRNMGLHVSIGTVIQKYIASLTLTGKLADLETAVYVISQVESRFSDRDGSIIYTTLMDGFLNALKFAAESEYHHKCLNSALQCLEHMIHKKYPVTTTTYNILLSELLQVGTEETVTRAMEVYEALRKRLQGSARSPKLERSYYFLLRTLWRMGKTDELLKVLSDMRADGILPTTERFKRLLERIYGDSSPFNF